MRLNVNGFAVVHRFHDGSHTIEIFDSEEECLMETAKWLSIDSYNITATVNGALIEGEMKRLVDGGSYREAIDLFNRADKDKPESMIPYHTIITQIFNGKMGFSLND